MTKHAILIRVITMIMLMVLILGAMATRLVYIQLVQGQEYAEVVSTLKTRTYTENASRGEILDRNGDKMVSNILGYSIELDYYHWDKAIQNDVILQLCDLFSASEIPYSDHLPITVKTPFAYTYESSKKGEGLKLLRFIEKQEGWPKTVTAPELYALLCERYAVNEDLGLADKRTIIGVRYAMESYEFSAYNTPFVMAESVDIDTVAKVSERAAQFPGVTIGVSDSRYYNTPYAAHVLGRVDTISSEEYAELKADGYGMNDKLGKDGVERAFESYLRGINGTRAVELDENNRVQNEFLTLEPDPGDNIYLTIDLGLQQVAEDALAATIASVKEKGKDRGGEDAEGAAAVVVDVNTGEVLAMASYPTYSLDTFKEDYKENYNNSLSPFYNRPLSGVYPPGSTFKMATALAGLEEGVITPSTKIRDQGVYKYYEKYQPRCWIYTRNGSTHGNINVSDALKHSCNYFFYETSRLLGIENLNKYARQLGLGEKTGIELAGEKAGTLAGPEVSEKLGTSWQGGETLMAGIGQSYQQFTPLQLANYVATIANGGTRYKLHLLKQIKDYSYKEVVSESKPEVLNHIDIPEEYLAAIKKGMKDVVNEGGTAASMFANFPIQVGGKTGSAQTSADRSDHGIFVSFAPFDKPEIAVCVIGEYAGSGGNMAPVCKAIYNHYFNLTPDAPDVPKPAE